MQIENSIFSAPPSSYRADRKMLKHNKGSHGPFVLAIAFTVVAAAGINIPQQSIFFSTTEYIPIHAILEFIAISVSSMVFGLGWNVRHQRGNGTSVLLASAFLAVALIDLVHTLSYQGMPDFITPSGPEKAIHFWLAERAAVAVGLLSVAILPDREWSPSVCVGALVTALAGTLFVCWLGLYHSEWLPRSFIPGQGLTVAKIEAEYALMGSYTVAALLLLRRSQRDGSVSKQWLAAASWTSCIGESYFTLYANVTDIFNLMGHVYCALAYVLIYKALFVEGVQAPYRALERERAHLATLLKTIPDLVWLKNSEGVFLACNPKFEQFFGAAETEIVGKTDYDFVHRASADFFRQKDREAMQAGKPIIVEEQLTYATDGHQIVIEALKTPMFDAAGAFVGILGIGRDITALKAAVVELRKFEAIVGSTDDAVISKTLTGVITTWNPAAEKIFGYSAQEAIGNTIQMLIPDDRSAEESDIIARIARGEGVEHFETVRLRKNGRLIDVSVTISPIRDGQGHVVGASKIAQDITQRKNAEEQIRELAFYDPLTHLPNRRLLMDRLRQTLAACLRSRSEGAILFIDLDDFKTVNDTLGHSQGDLMLLEVARRLTACVAEADTVARLGGDEFVVVLDDLGAGSDDAAAHAETVGRRVLAALSLPYEHSGHQIPSTSSIGISLFGHLRGDVDELMKQADIAMYQAKSAGRNTLRFYDPDLQAAIQARTALEAELSLAIREGQLTLFYQPQMNDGDQLVGAEALVRWRHPSRGLVSPSEFIPLAEDTGLILPLGNWVLETACRQIAAWEDRAEMRSIPLSVNVSARQFGQPAFVGQVMMALGQAGADPRKLKLELTESTLIHNVDDVIAKMTALKSYGVSFSLDDFGTGYSSLSYLKRLPLEQLKIDQAFVRDILADPSDVAIAKTIVALAESLGLDVIAEGVETAEQRNFLARLGCHAYQGYFFSRPLQLDDFEAYAAALMPARRDDVRRHRHRHRLDCAG